MSSSMFSIFSMFALLMVMVVVDVGAVRSTSVLLEENANPTHSDLLTKGVDGGNFLEKPSKAQKVEEDITTNYTEYEEYVDNFDMEPPIEKITQPKNKRELKAFEKDGKKEARMAQAGEAVELSPEKLKWLEEYVNSFLENLRAELKEQCLEISMRDENDVYSIVDVEQYLQERIPFLASNVSEFEILEQVHVDLRMGNLKLSKTCEPEEDVDMGGVNFGEDKM